LIFKILNVLFRNQRRNCLFPGRSYFSYRIIYMLWWSNRTSSASNKIPDLLMSGFKLPRMINLLIGFKLNWAFIFLLVCVLFKCDARTLEFLFFIRHVRQQTRTGGCISQDLFVDWGTSSHSYIFHFEYLLFWCF
jgi:hypothetical protein